MSSVVSGTPESPVTILGMPKQKKPRTEFGARLIDARLDRGMTQIQLAAAAGTTQRAISYYETGDGYPETQALIALAKVLHVSADDLLGIKLPKKERPRNDVRPETHRLWKKFQKVAALPERDQKAVIRLINSLASSKAA